MRVAAEAVDDGLVLLLVYQRGGGVEVVALFELEGLVGFIEPKVNYVPGGHVFFVKLKG